MDMMNIELKFKDASYINKLFVKYHLSLINHVITEEKYPIYRLLDFYKVQLKPNYINKIFQEGRI